MASLAPSIIAIAITLLTGSLGTSATDATTPNEEACTSYSAKLKSVPDLRHMVVYESRRFPTFEITQVKNTNYERSFYWCELEIQETETLFKRYRHFGFNSTHWWVEKGCSGWFWITECKLNSHGASKLPSIEDDSDDKANEDNSEEISQTTWPNDPRETISRHNQHTKGNFRQTPKGLGLAFDDGEADDKTAQKVTARLTEGSRNTVDVTMPHRNDSHGGPSHKLFQRSGISWLDDLYSTWPREGYHFPSSPAMWDWLDNLTSVDVAAQLGFYNRHVGGASL